MNDYCVYMHICPNGKRYVGMTCQEVKKRWRNGKAYKENKYFNNAINKWGWDNIEHKIIKSNLSKEMAEDLEMFLIKQYKSNQREYGYNIEFGGCHNGKTSEETRRKLSIACKGQHRSPATEFKKGCVVVITEEVKRKISKANKGKHACISTEFKIGHKPLNGKKVVCVETNIVYNTIKEAYKQTNIIGCHISQVCKGTRKTAGGFHWEYVKD